MTFNCLLCGVGGQGTVLAAKILAKAALNCGFEVKTSETIGMSQRGGSVVTHVRIGESISPLIPEGEADMIIGFEPGEVCRNLSYLRDNGFVVVSDKVVVPVNAGLKGSDYNSKQMISYLKSNVKHLSVIHTEKALLDLGSSKVLNMLLLGRAVSEFDFKISKDDIKKAVLDTVPEKFLNLNINAIDYKD